MYQFLHRWTIYRVVAGMDETQDSVSVHDEVAAELRSIVAVGVVRLFACQPGFEISPACPQGAGTPVGMFELIRFVDVTLPVKQHREVRTRLFEPLLDRSKRAEGNDQDAGVQVCKIGLVVAQLYDMLAAGYSAKVTEEDQQGISVFEHLVESNLLATGGRKGEVWGVGV